MICMNSGSECRDATSPRNDESPVGLERNELTAMLGVRHRCQRSAPPPRRTEHHQAAGGQIFVNVVRGTARLSSTVARLTPRLRPSSTLTSAARTDPTADAPWR